VLRRVMRVAAIMIAVALVSVTALYALLVVGSRKGIDYYYGSSAELHTCQGAFAADSSRRWPR